MKASKHLSLAIQTLRTVQGENHITCVAANYNQDVGAEMALDFGFVMDELRPINPDEPATHCKLEIATYDYENEALQDVECVQDTAAADDYINLLNKHLPEFLEKCHARKATRIGVFVGMAYKNGEPAFIVAL